MTIVLAKMRCSTSSHFVVLLLVAVSRFVTVGNWEGGYAWEAPPRNHKKRSTLDKLARDQDLLQQLQLHGLEGTDQGKLTKEVLTSAIKKYNTSGGTLKVTGETEELHEHLE